MGFTDLFIKKRVLAIAVSIAFLLVGLICYLRLPVREFPVVNLPIITIQTNYAGASPEVMEGFVSQPIEQAISGIDGVDYVTAENTQGQSSITIWLHVGADIDAALTEINTDISSVLWKLPQGINDPQVTKGGRGAPVFFINFGSNSSMISEAAVTDYVTRNVVPRIQSLAGVQSVGVYASNYAMRLWLDPNKMTANKTTATDIITAVNNANLQAPLGRLENNQEEFDLLSNAGLSNAEQFNKLVLKRDADDHIIRLSDVGHAALGEEASDISSFTNSFKHSVIVTVLPQNTANNIQLADAIYKILPEIKKRMPPGMGVSVLWDTSKFSRHAIHLVYETIWEAVFCVMVVIFLFLGSLRALLTPVVTIPLSLIGATVFMLLLDYSLNTFTLLAFVLAIGLVVDDSIVVLENIHRHIEMGKDSFTAALEAAREIFVPIIAMTLVVAVVFVPIAFTSGIIAPLFQEFGLTLSITVLLSGFFALILSPMMCANLFQDTKNENHFTHRINITFDKISSTYSRWLNKVFEFRKTVIACVLLVLCGCAYILSELPSELIPDEAQGVVLGVGKGPASASKAYMTKYARELEQVNKTVPELEHYGVVTGFMGRTSIISFLIMRDHQPRDRTEEQILADLTPKFFNLPGVFLFPMNRPALADVTGFAQPVQFVIQTTGTYNELYNVVQKIRQRIEQNSNIINVQTDLDISKPDINVMINRDRAADLGVTVKSITDTLGLTLGEPTIGWFAINGWSYPIIPRLMPQYYRLPQDLTRLTVASSTSGQFIPLSNLVTLQEKTVPDSLNQFQQLRSETIQANLAPGYSQGQALTYLEGVAKELLPSDMKYDFAGTSREFVQANGQAVIIFVTALMAIYLLLTIQFDSFLDPLIVMISVPLSTLGALVAIHWSGFTLNIYTKIGLVMLIGLISKHGILIVNFANHLQEIKGYDIRTAVVEAAKIRLRPILMTTGAMIVGAIPLALASGEGHEALHQIGLVIIGGLSFGSLLTLFVVPTFYTLLAKKIN